MGSEVSTYGDVFRLWHSLVRDVYWEETHFDGLNLHNFVKMTLPTEIADANPQETERGISAAASALRSIRDVLL
ncbi:hypothetical protein L3X38_031745 [Prunus dulcis]|uniref:Uncharacterized protein n=1 Tax=Prunus dulcis TaxID=3755 RepID=A0AAD4YVX7_PRUDU|nr:hypothetical protein L3X38_031745 [Prunus dulcis]